MKKTELFTADEALAVWNEVRKLNEVRAKRLLLHITECIRINAQCGVMTFEGKRMHANEIRFRIGPISRSEITRAFWNRNTMLDFYVNDADIGYVIDYLKELGYSLFDVRDRTVWFSFTVCWT